MSTSAVLLAAGRGRRMGRETNKVFLPVHGIPILSRAASALVRVQGVDELIVVAHPDELGSVAAILPPFDVPVRVVAGGAERRDSALAGVAAASGEYVLIHDAARPFPSPALIERVIAGARRCGACIPAIPEVDTLRRVNASGLAQAGIVDREGLVRVQTPQGFLTKLVLAALRRQGPSTSLTDDAAAVLAEGHSVAVVEGDVWNIKITTLADLELAGRMSDPVEAS
jgi:2-C-methyl-D-erythritol 4-phosphate cytidylyltransferase